MTEEAVGYGHPPREHQFKPGQSGNPSGRRRKAVPDKPRTEAEILQAIGEEIVEVGGKAMTMLELTMRTLYTRAAKGEAAAMRILVPKLADLEKEKARANQARKGGVLVVPGTMPLEQWSAAAALQQAGFRESKPIDDPLD